MPAIPDPVNKSCTPQPHHDAIMVEDGYAGCRQSTVPPYALSYGEPMCAHHGLLKMCDPFHSHVNEHKPGWAQQEDAACQAASRRRQAAVSQNTMVLKAAGANPLGVLQTLPAPPATHLFVQQNIECKAG